MIVSRQPSDDVGAERFRGCVHEGISEVLAGIQSIPECGADHEFHAGMAKFGHVESQHEFVALTYLSAERRSDTEFREPGNGL